MLRDISWVCLLSVTVHVLVAMEGHSCSPLPRAACFIWGGTCRAGLGLCGGWDVLPSVPPCLDQCNVHTGLSNQLMNQHKGSCQANPKPNVSLWEMQPDSFFGRGGTPANLAVDFCDFSGFGIPRHRMCEEREKLMAGVSSCLSIKQLHLPVPHQRLCTM